MSDTNVSYLRLGLDVIENYDPKHWIINATYNEVKDDIIVWGLPYQDINTMRGGKLKQVRIWTNINRWKPKISNIYIKQTYILFEILQECCQSSMKPI